MAMAASWSKQVQIVDAICDCTPGLSTLTNGAQLLYQLTHRVHDAASVITPGLQTEIKIHVLNKERLRLCVGMIPLLGNIYNLYKLVVEGWSNPMDKAASAGNVEVVRLCKANWHDDDLVLWWAASKCDGPSFEQILEMRNDWSLGALSRVLDSCS